MSRFDGTGPQGKGPMTGRGMGFCILQEAKDSPGQMKGVAGIQAMPIGDVNDQLTEQIGGAKMPRAYGFRCNRGFGFGRCFGRGRGCGYGRRGGRFGFRW